MDHVKTGSFIRGLRKEKNMTQKQLAEQLHITDRAVSKWERGLCAPDISLLEPLAKVLDVSILELLEGERVKQAEQLEEIEKNTKTVIAYSKTEIAYKLGTVRKKYLRIITACAVAAILLCGLILWQGGHLFVIDRSSSPDGNACATVYRKALTGGGFSMEDATSLIVDKGRGEGEWRITYGNCAYQGLWWAPDSRKYVLSLKDATGTQLVLAWLDRNSESNLDAYLSMGVEMTELSKYSYVGEGVFPDIEYQFLQWAPDSASMLIYYCFEDKEAAFHEGYFWYNCEDGTVSAVLELGVRDLPGESGGFQHTYTVDTTIPSSVVLDEMGMFIKVDGRITVLTAADVPAELPPASEAPSAGDTYTVVAGDCQ